MKRERFHEGDLVEIVTVNHGRKAIANRRRKALPKERWRAVVIGPSVIGPGWWVVKKLNGRRPHMSYTVPDIEMVRLKQNR